MSELKTFQKDHIRLLIKDQRLPGELYNPLLKLFKYLFILVVYSGSPAECACECTKTKGCTNWGFYETTLSTCYLKHTLSNLQAVTSAQSGSLFC